jgi:hypothetical protein
MAAPVRSVAVPIDAVGVSVDAIGVPIGAVDGDAIGVHLQAVLESVLAADLSVAKCTSRIRRTSWHPSWTAHRWRGSP